MVRVVIRFCEDLGTILDETNREACDELTFSLYPWVTRRMGKNQI